MNTCKGPCKCRQGCLCHTSSHILRTWNICASARKPSIPKPGVHAGLPLWIFMLLWITPSGAEVVPSVTIHHWNDRGHWEPVQQHPCSGGGSVQRAFTGLSMSVRVTCAGQVSGQHGCSWSAPDLRTQSPAVAVGTIAGIVVSPQGPVPQHPLSQAPSPAPATGPQPDTLPEAAARLFAAPPSAWLSGRLWSAGNCPSAAARSPQSGRWARPQGWGWFQLEQEEGFPGTDSIPRVLTQVSGT